MWLCLHAERGRGAVSATLTELAKAVGKKESDIALAMEELQQRGVCKVRSDGIIEIQDRFWPYQRNGACTGNPEGLRYVAEVKRLFLERRCVHSSFTAADEKLALSLFRRGVSLIQIERAILLGSLRKYISALQNAGGTPINSLHLLHEPLRGSPAGTTESILDLYRPEGEDIRANLAWVSCPGMR